MNSKVIFFIISTLIMVIIFLSDYPINMPVNNSDDIVSLSMLIKKTNSEKKFGHKIQVEIQNGCGLKGIAKLYTNFLRDKGYDVISFKNAPHFLYKKTQLVVHQKDTLNFTNEMIDILKINSELVDYSYNNNLLHQMTIIIGDDYKQLDSFNEVKKYYEPF
tara:strand:+ start:614 stop:1096 length:483 start_codon:yes stop_codon:yes gene_type:complete